MSSWEKLLQRVRNLDKDLCFEDLSKVLKHYGYSVKKNNGGSHYSFKKIDNRSLTLPYQRKMKVCYIKMVKNAVIKEENNEK